MRDKNRIEPFLQEFKNLWEHYPDLRFGQLIYIFAEKLGGGDIFFPEDDKWSKAIDEALKDNKKKWSKD